MDWGQKFEKLAQIYCAGTEADEGSEDDSPNALNKPSRSPPFLPLESSSELSRNGVRPSPPSPAPSSPSSSVATGNRSSYMTKSQKRPQAPVLVTKSTASGPPTYVSQSKVSGTAQVDTSSHSSSHKLNQQKIDPQSVPSNHKLKAPPSSLPCTQQVNAQTLTKNKRKADPSVTTINNLYTNPAQRSAVTTKGPDASCDKLDKTLKEPVVNGHLISSPGPRQCVEKAAPQLIAAGNKKCDNQKAATTAKSAKGVETWC